MQCMTMNRLWPLLLAMGLLAGCAGEDVRTGNEPPGRMATAEAVPSVAGESSGEQCSAHGVSARACFICDPALRDPGRLWCRGHDRYEDRCWLCHPELRDADRLYCDEHGLYEDECAYCHPDLLSSAGETVPAGAAPAELYCNEHQVYERECGICQPALADGLEPGQGLKIRLPSPEAARKAGVSSSPVAPGRGTQTVTVPGELRFNQNRLARITPQVAGVVRRVHVDLGQEVSVGEELAAISSPEIAEAKATLHRARAEEIAASEELEREDSLYGQGVSAEQELHEARARHAAAATALRAAMERLLDLGFAEADVAGIERSGSSDSRLVLRAPFAGTITARQAVVGDVVTTGDELFAVCDLSDLWLDLAVPQAVSVHLRPGAKVRVRPPGFEGRDFVGKVTWIASELDSNTRLARVRAALPNPGRMLKAGMYVETEITLGAFAGAVGVDREVVHRFGGRPFVFLQLEADLFEVRRVDIGGDEDGRLMVRAGLDAGDRLVVAQSYLVKSEFQKSRLGAGCVD